MTAEVGNTVLWGILWFLAISVGVLLIYIIVVGIGVLIATAADQSWIAGVFVVLAWIAAIVWEIFAIWHFVIECITLYQLLTT